MKHLTLNSAAAAFALLAGLGLASSAGAQTAAPAAAGATAATPAAGLTVGAKVLDPAGGVSGTIESISGNLVVVTTGTNKVGIDKGSFAIGPNGPVISMTREQLDASAAKAAADNAAAVNAALVAGAAVYDNAGVVVGTIKEHDAQFATVTTSKGDGKLPRTAFAKGPNGLMIGMSVAQLEAAVAAAKPAATAKN